VSHAPSRQRTSHVDVRAYYRTYCVLEKNIMHVLCTLITSATGGRVLEHKIGGVQDTQRWVGQREGGINAPPMVFFQSAVLYTTLTGRRRANNWDCWDGLGVFNFFFARHRGWQQSKRELTLDHSQHPIPHCGLNEGGPDKYIPM
jgi:hypothetical protein